MGFRFFKRQQDSEGPRSTHMDSVNERYEAYFHRLYTYVRCCVGGDVPAQDIVVQAFAQAFGRAGTRDEDKFRTVLFRAARRLCRSSVSGETDDDDGLNGREREIISLVFDAALTRSQIAHLFHIREDTVSSLLMSGLRKLKEQTSPAAAAAYLELA